MTLQEVMEELEIDRELTLKRFCGSAEMLTKFLLKFLEDKSYSEMLRCFENQDYDGAYRAVHTLKGITGNLGLDSFFSNCNELLIKIRANKSLDNTEKDLEVMEKEYEKIRETLLLLKG